MIRPVIGAVTDEGSGSHDAHAAVSDLELVQGFHVHNSTANVGAAGVCLVGLTNAKVNGPLESN